MAAEDFANFTGGIQDSTDALGDFSDALGDAANSAGDAVGFGGGAGGGGDVGSRLARVLPSELANAADIATSGGSLKEMVGVLMHIASAGLPPGVGTVLTKAIGSKL
jgi:hypothetical protein